MLINFKVLCGVVLSVMTMAACTDDPIERITPNACACTAAELGTTFDDTQKVKCEDAANTSLAMQSEACIACLDKAVGNAASGSACDAATLCPCNSTRDAELFDTLHESLAAEAPSAPIESDDPTGSGCRRTRSCR